MSGGGGGVAVQAFGPPITHPVLGVSQGPVKGSCQLQEDGAGHSRIGGPQKELLAGTRGQDLCVVVTGEDQAAGGSRGDRGHHVGEGHWSPGSHRFKSVKLQVPGSPQGTQGPHDVLQGWGHW